MDDHFENPRYNAKQLIHRLPSDSLNSGRIFFGCEGNEPFLPRVIEELGDDKLLFSSDYPHADRTDGTARMLQAREDLSLSSKNRILEENARRFYGI
jgi:predicted TIM-barrel fold metal-dependent hydrolase